MTAIDCPVPRVCETVSTAPEPLPYVDTVPEWLAPLLLLFGLAGLLVWFVGRYVAPFVADDPGVQAMFALLFAAGALFAGTGFLLTSGLTDLFVVFLFLSGRAIQGASTLRMWRKVAYVLRNRSFPGDFSSLVKKLRYRAIRTAIPMAATGLMVLFLLSGTAALRDPYTITLVWTMGVLATSMVGFGWKLEYVEEELGPAGVLGVLLCIAGAEVYNYVNIGLDVGVVVVGFFAHLGGVVFGFVVVVGAWLLRKGNRLRPSSG